jgi:hypothetical protein
VGFLSQGTVVQVAAKVQGYNWYQVERDGQPLGYVFGSLLGDLTGDVSRAQAQSQPQVANVPARPSGTKTYNVMPVSYNGQRLGDMEDIVLFALQGMAQSQVVRRPDRVAPNDIVVTASLTKLSILEEPNPSYAGAQIAGKILESLIGIGQLAVQNTPPSFRVVEVHVVIAAEDRRTGSVTTEQGVAYHRVDSRLPQQQVVLQARREAFEEAASRLATRLAGAMPPPLRTAAQIRKEMENARAQRLQGRDYRSGSR